ncbi:M23 family metallopeptidase [Tenacibaculum finnmarkense]|uniref:Peptidase M23 n=1 Tax=Tenacibaculum finnmarkense genomovar ulcerans TaxID=2781388 RepID=A0A2I2M924_9FLAO|nr:M23 family metallopeptidase [Tenacibaculum finnmarkense]ALU75747.1 peptidase M23 [Tenacibaculum dicentrarchi]MBE7633201.1 peptidoglycan DD-metalloendopeptidase family protein [Tenacibaculum finnmarkense genomovar ulcerans]MBE7696335.1 peptidoglycan DD-metalloendopeptidase family protein [Tenacibaculum finnmarkense genomovar ulcerans]MCD8429115.1 M23 family metallopeptidase [Tenacibaculum finnmarkense genomovar ulcerans]SOU89038.1 Peptidase M23 [Tenacibaculum finnmarkense genomovar ulcerans]
MAKNKKRQKLKQKLVAKYRLVILNEDTFQEKFSLKLSRLNVFVFGGVFSILLIAFTSVLIAFTGLREYIPGYSSTSLKRKATRLIYQTDSLKTRLAIIERFTTALQPVLTGEISPDKIDSIKTTVQDIVLDTRNLAATKEDSLFREKIEKKDRFPLSEGAEGRAKIVFFSPLTGSVSQVFNRNDKHYAIDIVAKKGTPVKVVADGTVILAEWTAETGYVITIQHADEFISVYKHNGTLLKQQGDLVKSGEAIASVGATGELSTGPHLHFELWHSGFPVNPTDYIDFQ